MTSTTPQIFEPDGRSIPFVDEGEGVVVVLLPGRGLSIASLGTVAHVLVEEGFRIVRIGVRRGDAPEGLTLHDLAQDAVDVMSALGLESSWIGGHGFGGAVARTIALDHPGRAEGLVLLGVDTPDELSEESARARATAFSDAPEAEARAAVQVLAGSSVDPEFAWKVFSRVRDLDAEAIQAAALAATPGEEWAPLAPRIPVLIMQGTDDRVTPVQNGEQLQATAPERASMARVEGGGHLFAVTHPGEIGAEIEDYLGWD